MAETIPEAKVVEVRHWVQDYRYNGLDHNDIENDASGVAKTILQGFPLHCFDDTEYEVRHPEEWLRLGRAADGSVRIPAKVCLPSKADFLGEWVDGTVTDYDLTTQEYAVDVRDVGTMHLPRLYFCFKTSIEIIIHR